MSKIEVNTVAPQDGTTLTLGESGDTVTLGTGASQSGFGRSGSVNWVTTPKTSTFTAVNGEGYFVNSGSSLTMNLPAGSAGAIVAVADYAGNFETYNLVVSPNGSEKIAGTAANAALEVNGQAATFVYVDSTKGWINIQNVEDPVNAAKYVAATGGTVTTVSTNFKVHTFTGPGTFCVSNAGNSAGSDKVDYLIIAGGGGGTTQHSGGGGGGGFRGSFPSPGCNAGTTTVTATGYPIAVGGGGAKTPTGPSVGGTGTPGVNSTWNSITSAGGGGGGAYSGCAPFVAGAAGGSGGGGASGSPGPATSAQGLGGAGNTPPQSSPASPVQGHAGGYGVGHVDGGGGGGGAGAVGGNAAAGGGGSGAGVGGAGKQINIDGNNYYWGGGGGGGSHSNAGKNGGIGGGGAGAGNGSSATGGGSAINAGGDESSGVGGAGGTNSGGGGGSGACSSKYGGNGGSGIVILRYKFQ